MAHTANQTTSGFSVAGILSAVGRSIYSALEQLAESQSRVKKIEFLQSLSDDELAKRGIARDRIVHHVFADRMGI